MKGLIEKKLFSVCCILLLALMAVQPIAASRCKGKQRWPELVGTKGKIAAATINKENRLATAVLCPPMNKPALCFSRVFRCDRVIVFVDKVGGVVTSTPGVG